MPASAVEQELRSGVGIEVRGVNHVARGGQQTLRDIGLSIAPGELVAIIGASGAGKTSLIEALCGVTPPSQGTVEYDGVDYYANQRDFRTALGYVPQDDIIHRELSLARTLRYAARLRLPRDTPKAEIERTVRWVLDVLGLTSRADVRIGSLSGGERKRASIAVELLTGPQIFFLDEPTSGLDPASAYDLMRLLRRLADLGTTVVFSTHRPFDVEHCDRVVVLEQGGALAFAGTPIAARSFFGVGSVEEIYVELEAPGSAVDWSERYATLAPTPTPTPAEPAPRARPVPREHRRPVGAVGQWSLLTRRTVDTMFRNWLTIGILIGSPAAVVAMLVVLFKPGAFDVDDPSPDTTAMLLFWVAFGGFFFGLTYGLLQICVEFPILRRERLVVLRIGPYVLSKVAVLLPVLAVVDGAMLLVLRLLDRLPPLGWVSGGALFVTLLLSSVAALSLGLLASAAVADPSQATLMLPMLCFPQVLFSGAILPVPAMAAVGRWISYAMSNRWAFEALGHSAGLEALWRDGGSPLGPPLLAAYGESFSRSAQLSWVILAAFSAVLLFGTCLVLTARCGGKRKESRKE